LVSRLAFCSAIVYYGDPSFRICASCFALYEPQAKR